MGEVGALLGRVVAGKFEIEERVGSGAMGEVFRARHVVLDTAVALKIMRPDIAKDAMFKERFYREAKAASRLDHPNSVRVIDFGVEPDGLVYLAMEFLHGRDLLSVLREEWPLPDERVVDILVQTLGAVSTAHELGIVHRDLKPENIMVRVGQEDEGTRPYHVKVCDFGIAKLSDPRGFHTDSSKALTSSGTLIGTPEYMSPEQARGDPLDARSDIYSVGIVLYQLLVGKVPFSAENALGVVLKQVTDEPVPPSHVRPGVNPRLEAICLRALRKPREERYPTAKEMRRDLRAVFGSRPQSSTDESGPFLLPSAPLGLAGDPIAPTLVEAAAPTVAAPAPAHVASAKNLSDDFAPKQTSDGTELTVPIHAGQRWLGPIAGVALLSLVVGAVLVVVIGKREVPERLASASSPSTSVVATAHVGAAVVEEPSASPPPEALGATPLLEAAPPRAAETAPPAAVAKHGGGDDVTARQGAASVANVAATAAPAASAPTAAALTASAAPASAALGASAASATASGGPASAAPAQAAIAPAGAAYNPRGAYVALGALARERIREDVVRAKMAAALPQLSECYRTALLMIGSPVGGSAEIHMSIDDKGRITTFVNAPKLPPFARCAQRVLGSQTVPLSAMDTSSAGATASQWLTLHP
jgi:eukaryotic-like serine/threonine-protein kinase